jgi:hypothetical protein
MGRLSRRRTPTLQPPSREQRESKPATVSFRGLRSEREAVRPQRGSSALFNASRNVVGVCHFLWRGLCAAAPEAAVLGRFLGFRRRHPLPRRRAAVASSSIERPSASNSSHAVLGCRKNRFSTSSSGVLIGLASCAGKAFRHGIDRSRGSRSGRWAAAEVWTG